MGRPVPSRARSSGHGTPRCRGSRAKGRPALTRRFPIRFDPLWRALLGLVFLSPSQSYVDIAGDEVEVRMGWAFRARFPRSSVASAGPLQKSVLSIGVHGAFGRWLVNGSSRGLVKLTLEPAQRARVLGIPVGLRELTVSAADPEDLERALSG